MVFATQEFEALLLREQERIEESVDPDETKKKAMERFQKEASKVMALINQHRTTLGDALQKIEEARTPVEKTRNIRGQSCLITSLGAGDIRWLCAI